MRFVPWTSPAGSPSPNPNIVALLAAKDGSLWLGTGSGIARLRDGQVTTWPGTRGRVAGIAEDKAGNIWFVRSRTGDDKGPLCEVVGAGTRCFGAADGLAAPYGSALALAQEDGAFWVGHGTAVTRWTRDAARTFDVPSLKSAEGLNGVAAILPDGGDCILVGFQRSGTQAGLQRLCDGRWQAAAVTGVDAAALQVGAVLRGRDGTLWIGTVATGLYRVQGDAVERYRSGDGLSSDGVVQVFEDREGSLWVVTSQGLDRFRPLKVLSHTQTQGLGANIVQAVLATSTGKVWISNEGSLDAIDHGVVSSIRPRDGLPGQRVTSLLEDHAHVLWVGVDNQLYVHEHDVFVRIEPSNGATLGTVISLAEDSAHDVWAVTANPLALVRIHDRKVVDRFDASRLPSSGTVVANPGGGVLLALLDGRLGSYRDGRLRTVSPWTSNERHDRIGDMIVRPDGTVWGNSVAGLVVWNGDRVKVLTPRNGLPCDRTNALAQARNGDLWLSQSCGLVRIARAELDRVWSDDVVVLKTEVLDALDGALSGRSVFAPAASTSPDGTLWFANESILQSLDPEHLPRNDVIPPVHIERIVADRAVFAPAEGLQLPGRTRDLEIDYTALSLAVPQKVRFQYRLEGWDGEWQDPGTRRQAFYTNLDPGRYVFRVRASNDDGVWNDAGDSAAFAILPAYYQTRWFAFVVAAALIATLYAAYRLRVRQIAAQIRAGLLERLSERERIAKDLHDSFFQGIQGLLLRVNTATAQLKADEPARVLLLDALEQSDEVMLEGRELVLDLRTSATDDLDLSASLTRAGEEFKLLHPADFASIVLGRARPLHPVCADELHRLGREALYNAFRHAHASRIEVELHYGSTALALRVRDDGRGIDDKVLDDGVREGHWGLPGMQERASKIGARLRLSSRRGAGTEIEVVVPSSIAYAGDPRAWLDGWIGKGRPGPGSAND